MKYWAIISLALFGLSRAAYIPAEYRAETRDEPSCDSGHASTSSPATNSPATSQSTSSTISASLVPDFGITAGVDPQNGNCKGLNGILIPCACPPSRDAFLAKMAEFVAAGNAEGTPVSFPTDTSLNSQITRLSTAIVTLQNFNGRPGSGCPASSTTFVGQRAKLLALL